MSPSLPTTLVASLFLFCQIFSSIAQVPVENTFKFVNEGELGPFVVEYQADYRVFSGIFTNPFQFCFYNTTPNAWTLALRMGTVRSESLMRWVWEANRGNPVKENATFSLGTDGNLVLAEANGRIAWQTNTAKKGVTGFKLLPNGNFVLHNSKGKFIWQSFDHPTDTLLVGQSLRLSGPNKLVSRASMKKNVNGPYSLEVKPKIFGIYNRTKLAVELAWFDFKNSTLESIKLNSGNQRVKLDYRLAKSTTRNSHVMAFTKINTTLTYLRLEIDGNLKAYTFYEDKEEDRFRWRVTYNML
ncbi:epidermis-specific secreted glycoprotein EP1-like [Nicotiana tabacum]|uniref:epidermis-specific secreted glycoprotein EP1-like n=5 Tax=Nicotiana TaxID=4085 RepID=A0A0R4WFW8_TOBAC|nr:epidermis-specific secreted glycoprotein EP1-like precursor [Nicotiana tabacum]XP_009779101.1 PREDICTED: epidermis-specific secreted glycoprotein EP1-like [Nicotiana sylvestris]XP_009797872.1 PREDICTED: epidermis-specific secreted glycoprotein EP1-like [Nicotiana sylvestris]AFM78311.1 mannose-binding lectin [Nicotiana tabacum]